MALSRLNNLYMALVTEHSKSPHHFGQLEGQEAIQLNNPTCGDVISLTLAVKDDTIEDIAFSGHGCAISTASASMMTDTVIGKKRAEALVLAELFSEMVQGQENTNQDKLGDAAFMAGVSQFPQRVKCATLAWNALRRAIERSDDIP
ncbi:Fe-S cluster assembly sulfur transfer protein SufU [Streptococcus pluranimalium]|uniref:Fe-S cluster assembly sulfur transfer protein SufU n=1 Tax=Streptococcus pluranimalium TaxID=82348 RepID=UPI0039EC5029